MTLRAAGGSLNDSSCAPAHNTPLPLERSPPASFKRLLGSTFLLGTENALLMPEAGHVLESVEGVAPVIEANLPHSALSASEWELFGSKRIVEPPRAAEFLEALR